MKNGSKARIVAVRAKRRGARTWLVTVNFRLGDGRIMVARGVGLSSAAAMRVARRSLVERKRAAA